MAISGRLRTCGGCGQAVLEPVFGRFTTRARDRAAGRDDRPGRGVARGKVDQRRRDVCTRPDRPARDGAGIDAPCETSPAAAGAQQARSRPARCSVKIRQSGFLDLHAAACLAAADQRARVGVFTVAQRHCCRSGSRSSRAQRCACSASAAASLASGWPGRPVRAAGRSAVRWPRHAWILDRAVNDRSADRIRQATAVRPRTQPAGAGAAGEGSASTKRN